LENVDVASRLAEPGDAPREEAQFPIAARAALWVFRRGEPSHHRPNRPLTRIGQTQFPESSVYCKSRGMSVRSMTVGKRDHRSKTMVAAAARAIRSSKL
jgi:hypothetical protein